MATRSMPFWPRPATTTGSSWPGSGLCAPFSGRLSWSGITRAAPPPHPPERPNSLFHRRPGGRNLVAALPRRRVGRSDSCRGSPRRPPPSRFLGLAFVAEPTLTQAFVHVDLGVVTLPGHVIDVLALAVDVALDRAAFSGESVLLGLAPPTS